MIFQCSKALKFILLYRDKDSNRENDIIDMNVEIAKNRDGICGNIKMEYDKTKQIFKEKNNYQEGNMFKVWCYNVNRDEYFIKEFYFEKEFKKFYNKCKYSKKIKIIGKEMIEP